MAKDENDVTDGFDGRENDSTRRARQRALGENPMSTEQMADAVAKALQRTAAQAKPVQVLGDTVRASCRAGYYRDGSPKKYTFKASDTADGREWTIPHGKPIRLKREAYERLCQPMAGADSGVVALAE